MTAFLLLSLGLAAPPASWPQWRGPNRDGIVSTAAWPADLKSLEMVWRSEPLGPSYSGPIVSADQIFTTETVDKKTEVVTAFNRANGKVVWTQKWDGSMTVPFFAASNGSWIRSTPALDGDSLYVAGIRDRIVCLNTANGDIRWAVDCMKEFSSELPAFGCVSSPLVDSDAVYIQAGGGLLKLNKSTGKTIWRVLPEKDAMMGSAFSSPILGKIGETKVVYVQTRTRLAAVNAESGQVVFEKEIPSFRGMNILTPQPYGDGLFTSTYGGNTQFVKIVPSGDGFRTEEAWKIRYEGNMTSPVVLGDHAYVFGKDQKFVCFDLKAGKEAWRSDRTYGKYWSLVASGDRILALDSRGTLYLIKADPKAFTVISEKKVSERECWAHLAVVGDEIIIRDLERLTVWKWK